MEWREQPAVGCELAFTEAQRWIEEVTRKKFGSSNFRSALENGVLLCDLINKLKPGIIKRLNRLSTPIAGLDNVNVFLKACGKLGLNDAQLFHPGDLQDVSTRVAVRHEETSRRLKNVLITIYWLGRKAQADSSYSGPQLNFKAFEGLLGVALSKALEEASCSKSSVKVDCSWDPCYPDGTGLSYSREDSVESHTLSVASDCTLVAGSEGFGSDAEAEHCFRMSECDRNGAPYEACRERRNVPAAVRRKRAERQDEGRDCASPLLRSKSMSDITLEPVPKKTESNTASDSWKGRQDRAGKIFINPSAINNVQWEQMQQIKTRLKENEIEWQEDLKRWKSRRRSTNSELHRKKEEREQLEPITTTTTSLSTEVQQQSEQEEFHVFSTHQQVRLKSPEPTSTPEPCSSSLNPSQPHVQREELHLASLASEEAFAPSAASPLTVSCMMPVPMSSAGLSRVAGLPAIGPCLNANGTTKQDHYARPVPSRQSQEATAGVPDYIESSSTVLTESSSTPALVPRAKPQEAALSGAAQMSAALPRGFRRSESSSRLSTGVTPRPFGAKPSRMSSMPRLVSVDDSYSGLYKDQRSQVPSSFSLRQSSTADNETQHPTIEWKEAEEQGTRRESAPSIHSFMSASIFTPPPRNINPHKAVAESAEDKVNPNDVQVTLSQNPKSGKDFGFEAHWDSTGSCIKSVKPGSPAQLCHLQVGDEIVAVGGRRVADMSYEQWKANMDAALREGKLLMEIRRKTLNGHADHCTTISNTSNLPVEKASKAQVNGSPVNGLEESRSISDSLVKTKNKGGSESAISDLQVPAISVASSRWSWNPQEDRRRHEKWQLEQERRLQEKCRQDQERLQEQWRRAQQEAVDEEFSRPEPTSPFPSNGETVHYIPPSLPCESIPATAVASSRCAAEEQQMKCKQVRILADQTKDQCDSSTGTSQWSGESCGFTGLPSLDRTKSKSTPSLDACDNQDPRGSVMKKGRLSQAEHDRRQILDEMKKKTSLLTDNSWIRQHSTASLQKDPVSVAPIMRYESLDNLHTSSSSTKQFSSSSQPAQSRPASSTIPYRGYSGRCSLGPGAAIFSKSLRQSSRSCFTSSSPTVTSVQTCPSLQQQNRLSCSRCERSLGKGSTVIIESLDLSFHVGCFKCVSCRTKLGSESESRAQVRVRNKQLFCDPCYSRLRVCTGIPK